jgi:hypothetical protein
MNRGEKREEKEQKSLENPEHKTILNFHDHVNEMHQLLLACARLLFTAT